MTGMLETLPRAARAIRAWVLIGTLSLGAVSHFWHHVQDPECGAGLDRTGHVCVACAGLHGSTLVVVQQQAPPPAEVCWRELAAGARSEHAAAPRAGAAPRAPPIG
jgi:hypothetical protein